MESTHHSGPSPAKHVSTCLTSALDFRALPDQDQRGFCAENPPQRCACRVAKQQRAFSETLLASLSTAFFLMNKQINKASHTSPAVWQRHSETESLCGLRGSMQHLMEWLMKGFAGIRQ